MLFPINTISNAKIVVLFAIVVGTLGDLRPTID